MSPAAASAAEGVWSHLLVGVDLISDSEEPDSVSAKALESCLTPDCGHHRGGVVLLFLEPGSDLRPTQPSDLSGDLGPTVLYLKLLPELSQPSILRLTHVPGQGDVVDADPLPPLLDGDVHYAGVDRSGRPEYQIPVLKEVSEGGRRGGDTEEAAGLRATDSLDPGAADARAVEGSRLPSP